MTTEARHSAIGAAIVALVSIAVVAPHTFPFTSIGTLSYDWLDADLFLWNFWWTRQAVSAAQQPYLTELLMYPTGASLAFHSYPLPYSLLTLPVQSLMTDTRGLVVSFNGIVMFSSLASGLGAYFLALRTTKNVAAAVIAGLVFVCAPYRALNISRLHVLATEVLAWYAWAWVGFAERPTRGRALPVGACLAFAIYTSPEYAVHVAFFSALWLARGSLPRGFWGGLAIAALICVALASPLLVEQVRSVASGETSPRRPLAEVSSWSPALASFVTPSRVHPLYGDLLAGAGDYGMPGVVGMRSETTIALTVWALAFVGLRRTRQDGSWFWFVAAAGFLVLTLGPFLRLTGTMNTSIPMPYAALYWLVPPMSFARDPTRLFAMVLLMFSVVSAFGTRALLDRLRGQMKPIVAAAGIGALVIFEGLTIWPGKVPAQNLISPAYDLIAGATGTFAVLDLSPDQTALLGQTRHGRPITAGRVSNPRASGAATMTGIERDFLDAAATLALDSETLASRLETDRRELESLRLRFVVFPTGNKARIELARRLGLRVRMFGDRVVCERL